MRSRAILVCVGAAAAAAALSAAAARPSPAPPQVWWRATHAAAGPLAPGAVVSVPGGAAVPGTWRVQPVPCATARSTLFLLERSAPPSVVARALGRLGLAVRAAPADTYRGSERRWGAGDGDWMQFDLR